jgi:hypothetical protein
LFKTARHSSGLLWSGKDILLLEELEEPKRLPKGIAAKYPEKAEFGRNA